MALSLEASKDWSTRLRNNNNKLHASAGYRSRLFLRMMSRRRTLKRKWSGAFSNDVFRFSEKMLCFQKKIDERKSPKINMN